MRLLITGHRVEKLVTYDAKWIAEQLHSLVESLKIERGVSLAYSGMASGVDLWFCEACFVNSIPYIACVPFDEQEDYMDEDCKRQRRRCMELASGVKKVKNSWMVEHADIAIAVWDGNKGGTHNVVQQLVEKNKPFVWLNPVGKKIWHCA